MVKTANRGPPVQRARGCKGIGGTMNESTTQKVDNRRDGTEWVISPPDEFHPLVNGDTIGKVADLLYAPSGEEIRGMLFELRRQQRWSQAFAAAVLGVTEGAVVKWEAGNRKPNGAARKLIFLLYSQIVERSGKVKNCWDLACWGGMPCRNTIPLLNLCATYWVPDEVMNTIMTTPVERLKPELRRVLGLDLELPLRPA
jgi:DNA-binding XRE family transcriptional regulator